MAQLVVRNLDLEGASIAAVEVQARLRYSSLAHCKLIAHKRTVILQILLCPNFFRVSSLQECWLFRTYTTFDMLHDRLGWRWQPFPPYCHEIYSKWY
jgi:hypothetical protein